MADPLQEPLTGHKEGEEGEENKLIDPIMINFMHGQFANLFKFAYWWVALAPLLYAMTNTTSTIGTGRIVYNTALCILTPIGAILVEHAQPRSILLSASVIRFIIWCVIIPITWVVFDTDLVDARSQTAIYVILLSVLFFDGAAVASSTVLDIDFCGIDVVAGRFGLDVTEAHRNQFNARQELFFAVCFIIFAPAMAFIGLGIKRGFSKAGDNSDDINSDQVESGTLVALFFVTFLIATILQFFFLWGLKPKDQPGDEKQNDGEQQQQQINETPSTEKLDQMSTATATAQGNSPREEEGGDAPPSIGQAIRGIPRDLWEAVKIIVTHRPVLFRLLFLGLEIAFEDAAIVVLAAQMGVTMPWLGNGDAVLGNVWTSVAVAVGKLGGAVASFGMMKFYTPPDKASGYGLLFACIGLSCIVIVGLPLTVYGHDHGTLNDNASRACFLLVFFFYFLLSTLPKLGLMALLQTMIMSIENGHRAFGFIAVVATTCDSLVIMALSALFINNDTEKGVLDNLWICAYVYLGHGVLETVFGPLLILTGLDLSGPPPPPAEGDEQQRAAADTDKGAAEQQQATDEQPPALEEEPAAAAQRAEFTQRSVAVPVVTPRTGGGGEPSSPTVGSAAIPIGGGGGGPQQGGSSSYAVLSTSHHGAMGATVMRRQSGLGGGGASPFGGGASDYRKRNSYLRQGGTSAPRSPRSPRRPEDRHESFN